jgi:hypothetical protein
VRQHDQAINSSGREIDSFWSILNSIDFLAFSAVGDRPRNFIHNDIARHRFRRCKFKHVRGHVSHQRMRPLVSCLCDPSTGLHAAEDIDTRQLDFQVDAWRRISANKHPVSSANTDRTKKNS